MTRLGALPPPAIPEIEKASFRGRFFVRGSAGKPHRRARGGALMATVCCFCGLKAARSLRREMKKGEGACDLKMLFCLPSKAG